MKRFPTMLLFLLLALPALADAGFTQDITWRLKGTSDPIAQAIYLLRTGQDAQSSRLLVVTPRERHLVLTNRLRANGILEMTLRDEQSGWTASLTQNFGAQRNTLQELFRALDPDKAKGTRIELTFQATNASPFTVALPFHARPEEAFANQMMETETAAKTRVSIPEELKRELPFLAGALTDDVRGATFRGLVAVLRMIVDDKEATPDVRADLGGRTRGWQLTAADQLQFAAAFPSVSMTDPLADR